MKERTFNRLLTKVQIVRRQNYFNDIRIIGIVRTPIHLWKKTYSFDPRIKTHLLALPHSSDHKIKTHLLALPDSWIRFSSDTDKLRVSLAYVVSLRQSHNHLPVSSSYSKWDTNFAYVPGSVITPRYAFNQTLKEDCGSGIHACLSWQEALKY